MAGKTNNKATHRNADMASDSVINSSFDENQWVVWIEELIQRDLDEAMKVPASIFPVPESTSKHNPESYIPTGVALGPYHHFQPELFRMEVYKIHKAKLARAKFQLPQFRHLVNEIRQRELTIRACFYKYIPMECETFAWVMVIDGLYLIWLLGICTDMIGNPGGLTGEKTTVKVLAANEVERDVLLLENQIPMEVLLRIMTANRPNEDLLSTLLFNYCAIVSPFELASSPSLEVLAKSYHMLHFLYNLILIPIEIDFPAACKKSGIYLTRLGQILGLLGSITGVGLIQQLSESLDYLKTLSDIKETGRNLFAFEEKPDPLIPSASKLAKVGIGFKPTQAGIKGVNFWRRQNDWTFKLPLIRVNYFSEIILRNLVAFEATSKMGPPVLARYIGLMNGLVKTPEDVKILKTALIISNDLGGDEEVVELFSRVWKYAVDVGNSSAEEAGDKEEWEMESVKAGPYERGLLAMKRVEEEGQAEKLISLPVLGKRIRVIEDVNKYYYSLGKVKIKRFFKKYVLSCVKILFLVVLFCILILVILRTICSFFSCPKFLKSS